MFSMMSSIIEGLRRAGFVLLVGAVGGLIVYASTEGGLSPSRWSAVPVANSILVGVLYAALLDGTVRIARLMMDAFVPLRSVRTVIAHALVPAGGAFVVFLGLTAGLKAGLNSTFPLPWPTLVGVGSVAALAVAGGAGLLALRQYYRHERQDQAEGWQARMRRLRTQTLPSVTIDTLQVVSEMLATEDLDPAESKPLVDRLHALLRYRQQAASEDRVPLSDELEAVLTYVELAQVRHGDALEVGFDIPDALLSVPVPRLCLLPLLENAVQHGAQATDDTCTVTVTGRHDNDRLCLAVLDTGPGFDTTDPDTILRRGSGLADLYARLRDHFGEAAELSLLPQGVLWCAPITATSDTASTSQAEAPIPSSPE